MGTKLLLADDSITIQKVVGIIFANDEEYALTVVDNGNAALEKAREIRPDVMLVDALMPGKTGYEVCEAVRSDAALATVPILLMTGAFEPFDEEKARRCGADDFISKPFESQQLIDKVRELAALAATRASQAPAEAAAVVETAEPFSFEAIEPFAAAERPVAETTFGGEAPFAAGVAEQSPAAFFAVEEAAPSDDLWGAFELEDEVVGEVVAEDEAGEEVVEAAAFALEQPGGSEEAVEIGAVGEFGLPATEFAFSEEEPPAFAVTSAEEEVSFAPAAEEPAGFVASDNEPFTVEEVEPAESLAEELAASTAAFAAEEVAFGAPAMGAVEPAAVASPEVAGPAAGTVTLTEEQLAAAISRISREIIERIAWDVVPDLAETLIKEEIRRIKTGGE